MCRELKKISNKLQINFQYPKSEYTIISLLLQEKLVGSDFTDHSRKEIRHNSSLESSDFGSAIFDTTISTKPGTEYQVKAEIKKNGFDKVETTFTCSFTVQFELPGI